ncbi:hypothetical protein AGMMS49579_19500 [Spirochaetia bacterium]|nr:hypothetical protein AGMMS49579_19500 [Spirochaetia bacterium]
MINYTNHIAAADDLVTSYNETRAGFIAIALEKNRQATPFIAEARVLQNRAKKAKSPADLLQIPDIRNGLIAAAGISDKAAGHLGDEGCTEAIQEFVKNFLVPAGDKFNEELIFRFLLTKGDSLGGKMRNIVGALSQRKLCLSIVSSLRLSGKQFYVCMDNTNEWVSSLNITNDIDIENAKGLSWDSTEVRTLFFNITIPIVKNNIDIIVVNKPHTESLKEIITNAENYIALGELKGGIDPAGADEHWKTAKTALDRIKVAFEQKRFSPQLFFIGAAIESKMAGEIYTNLQTNYLQNAANLTKPEQIISLAEWLVKI